jgi:dephospho-CoA kinase
MIVIGITGTLGAGKGTAVEYLKTKGFRHYSARDFITNEIVARGLPVNRDSMVVVANDLRQKNSPSYIIEQLYSQAEAEGVPSIIESIRTPGEVKALKSKGDFTLLAIDADIKIRYERIRQRGSATDLVDYDTFVTNEKREMTNSDPTCQNLSACIAQADQLIFNNGTFEDLYHSIDQFLNTIKGIKS